MLPSFFRAPRLPTGVSTSHCKKQTQSFHVSFGHGRFLAASRIWRKVSGARARSCRSSAWSWCLGSCRTKGKRQSVIPWLHGSLGLWAGEGLPLFSVFVFRVRSSESGRRKAGFPLFWALKMVLDQSEELFKDNMTARAPGATAVISSQTSLSVRSIESVLGYECLCFPFWLRPYLSLAAFRWLSEPCLIFRWLGTHVRCQDVPV